MVLGLLSTSKQGDSVYLSISPSTNQIVLQQGVTGTNVLVGYVSVRVSRPTSISGLTVTFIGEQQLDIRAGVGPSGSNYSVRSKCANFSQQLVDETSSVLSNSASLALARVSSIPAADGSGSSAASTYDLTSPPPEREWLRQSEDSSIFNHQEQSDGPMLMPGEYRFAFEFTLPPTLPASVSSRLGDVEYRLTASLSYRSWFHPRTTAKPVAIEVLQAPPLHGRPEGSAAAASNHHVSDVLLLGYPSLQALTDTPLLFETVAGGGCSGNLLKISVYSPNSSRALFLDTPLKLQVYATHQKQQHQPSETAYCRAELVEFRVALHEVIVHTIPGSAAKQTTRKVVAESSLCPRSASKQHLASTSTSTSTSGRSSLTADGGDELPTLLDPQTIDALGDSFNELPSVGSLDMLLPSRVYQTDSRQRTKACAVQPSSSSPLFSVSHQLHVSVSVRESNCDTPNRVSFHSPVIVLPEVLARGGSQIAVASLPCYNGIANDIVLAASSLPAATDVCHDDDNDRDSAVDTNPPDYAALYK
ncbi:hypothetical protein IW140_002573 [Coemansia sp. RSA 1813]|nr:hypothetical protein EV178_002097 [Coemansia sp. RSA 1646]KAJ1772726.1 hypothetical protein LPJ74_001252 [Coemansia sp. RSA 1843]KAJ2090678.1 hypothetical protein IW138_002492 [Coemansia sp. RSA 986]KAJ2216118.1 hypothetical protein EV179_001578 [Coemansia sp. RSA 487]KAJ2570103.1 hypothetical protein IW140_002573 [Coemansia sp. RSA 1813]